MESSPRRRVCVPCDWRRETRRFGTINLARDVWNNVAQPQGWRLHGIVNDRLLLIGQKVSRIWKDTPEDVQREPTAS